MSQQLQYAFQQYSARDTYMYNFSSCENGAFLLVEAIVCCRFYYWSEIEVIRTKLSCKVPTLAWLSNRYWSGMGVTAMVQCTTQLGFTVVMWLRSEVWLVLLSGSGSNSLNSWKFLGRFSYGLGTRLVAKWHEHPARGPRLESCLDPRSFGGFLSLSKAYIQSL